MSAAHKLPVSGWCGDIKRGASLGRSPRHSQETQQKRKFHLVVVRLDSGGYDSGGAYWGVCSNRLYHAYSIDGEIDFFFRSESREQAKRDVRMNYPSASFFR